MSDLRLCELNAADRAECERVTPYRDPLTSWIATHLDYDMSNDQHITDGANELDMDRDVCAATDTGIDPAGPAWPWLGHIIHSVAVIALAGVVAYTILAVMGVL